MDWLGLSYKQNEQSQQNAQLIYWNNEVIQLEQTTTDIFLDADLFETQKLSSFVDFLFEVYEELKLKRYVFFVDT